ncbi:MAG: OmpA family protein [Polyangiaceae bacterium]|nr:OmpA family protein [Polyangiaceae bacterium]
MSNGASAKPKTAFYVAAGAVILGLVAIAVWRMSASSSKSGAGTSTSTATDSINLGDIKKQAGGDAENPAGDGITTVKEYAFEPGQRLPAVPGTGAFKELGKDRVVKFAINVWAGWAPILYANGGKGPGKVWKDAKGKEFKVEIILIDDPVNMGNTFAAGEVHVGWATVDMLPLVVQRLKADPRTMPRIYQQIDWSNGGDGIVVRDTIKDVAGLRGKVVVLAQNSPSHYFLLNVLLNAGVQPSEVNMKFTKDAFQAAAAFNADKEISGVVSWAPDIYNLEKVKGNKILMTTGTANKLIADVWFARADFARDNGDIIEGLVRGIFDAMVELKDDAQKQVAAKHMDDVYGLPPGTGQSMLADAHWTNYAENRDFFLNQNNPTNFERTYDTAYLLYRAIRVVDDKVPFDQLVDFGIIKKLGGEPKFADQKNEYEFKFTPAAAGGINVESAILTKTVTINFSPNNFDPFFEREPAQGGKPAVLYDPNVGNTIEEIAKLAGQFGAARIQIEGHTDGSMRGTAIDSLVRELSLNRANAVKQALVNKYKMNPNQFVVAGFGWDKPADPADPKNHAKNRRVEVRVIPAEAQ